MNKKDEFVILYECFLQDWETERERESEWGLHSHTQCVCVCVGRVSCLTQSVQAHVSLSGLA